MEELFWVFEFIESLHNPFRYHLELDCLSFLHHEGGYKLSVITEKPYLFTKTGVTFTFFLMSNSAKQIRFQLRQFVKGQRGVTKSTTPVEQDYSSDCHTGHYWKNTSKRNFNQNHREKRIYSTVPKPLFLLYRLALLRSLFCLSASLCSLEVSQGSPYP